MSFQPLQISLEFAALGNWLQRHRDWWLFLLGYIWVLIFPSTFCFQVSLLCGILNIVLPQCPLGAAEAEMVTPASHTEGKMKPRALGWAWTDFILGT